MPRFEKVLSSRKRAEAFERGHLIILFRLLVTGKLFLLFILASWQSLDSLSVCTPWNSVARLYREVALFANVGGVWTDLRVFKRKLEGELGYRF